MKKVAVYCRVATKEQCCEESLLGQRLMLEQMIGKNPTGYEKYRHLINSRNNNPENNIFIHEKQN